MVQSKFGEINPDFRKEAERIINAAKEENVLLRVMGALAFNIHCPKFGYMQGVLGRSFTDIDFASYRGQASDVSTLFADLGYREDFMVARLYGNRRRVFQEQGGNLRHCDVFFDKLEFCHDIVFENRLEVDEPTVPLAELLLEKMQIVKLNEKDVIDTIMLLREHEVGALDNETINAARIAHLTSHDWGLWKTMTTNLERVRQITPTLEKLADEDKTDVNSKIGSLLVRIETEPKTTGWKMRARIGEKRKWYRDVEDLTQL